MRNIGAYVIESGANGSLPTSVNAVGYCSGKRVASGTYRGLLASVDVYRNAI